MNVTDAMVCPRCGHAEVRELDRDDPARQNRVFRCRSCGHIWSPKL